MSEANQTPASDQHQAKTTGDAVPAGPGLPLGSLLGSDHRLDEPHAPTAPENDTGPENNADKVIDAAQPATDSSPPQPAARRQDTSHTSRQQRELLLQASQIAEQLQDQSRDNERREKNLNEQLAVLDQERRSLRLRVQEFEDQMLDREEAVSAQQAEFAHKFATCEKLVGELEQQQAEMTAARAALDAERAQLREELDRDLEVVRAVLRQAQAAVETEREQQRQELQQHRNECDAALQRDQDELAEERSKLHESVHAELTRERTEFENERAEWGVQHDQELAALAHERDINDAALTRAQEELLFAKREQETESERQTAELQASLEEIRTEFDEEQARKQAEWDSRREAEIARIESERELTAQAVHRSEDELRQQRAQQQQQLREEHEEFQRDCETRRQQLKQERTVLESRMQFQQAHLHKMGQQLEAMQHEWQIDKQQTQTELVQQIELQRLRANQLDHYRLILDERDQSFHREQQLLTQWRRTSDADVRREKARLRQEQDVWDQERRAQQAEVQRQQDLLTLHAENLEARRDRLDHLRTELEETHRRTLEMRMAMEEAWAQFGQAAGDDDARQRVEKATAALQEHYDRLSATVGSQQQELLDVQNSFQKQRDEFRGERRQLTEWIAERENSFRNWEQQLRQEADAIDVLSCDWRTARDGWQQEKVVAEGVIRSLLAQLSEVNGNANEVNEIDAALATPAMLEVDSDAPINLESQPRESFDDDDGDDSQSVELDERPL
jgi:hypothetical protein